MPTRKFTLNAFFLVIIALMTACSDGPNAQALESLKTFYKGYIAETSKLPENRAAVESLKAQHCTARYLKQLAAEDLEADPFLNAQDVEESWASNLEVTPDDVVQNQFAVCYTASFDNSKHCVEVTMVEDGGSWKIDNITH